MLNKKNKSSMKKTRKATHKLAAATLVQHAAKLKAAPKVKLATVRAKQAARQSRLVTKRLTKLAEQKGQLNT